MAACPSLRAGVLVLVLISLLSVHPAAAEDGFRELAEGYQIKFRVNRPSGWAVPSPTLFHYERKGPVREFTVTRTVGKEKRTTHVKATWFERAEVQLIYKSHASQRSSPRPASAADWREGFYFEPDEYSEMTHGSKVFGAHKSFWV